MSAARVGANARLAPLLASLVSLAAFGGGCRGSSKAAPSVTKPPVADATAKKAAKTPSVPRLRVALDDPRLARARALERAGDVAAAARAVHDARAARLEGEGALSVADACAWDYVEGRLFFAAGATNDAIAAFARAEGAACPLQGYARLRGAQALGRAGRADEAIAKAKSVPKELPVEGDVRIVLAESYDAKGDVKAALPLWRAWLSEHPYGSRWVDTSVRLANALLDGADGDAAAHAREAYDLVTKVVVRAPKVADDAGAAAARSRAVALLRAKDKSFSDALSDAERARQAEAWLDLGESTKAFELASAVMPKGKPKAKASAPVCKAAITRAKASKRVKHAKGDPWADAVALCDGHDELVTALYVGAKARAGKDPKLSLSWFGRIEREFHGHRLADDARFRSALLVREGTEEGDEARAEQMLESLSEAYPEGDMQAEGLFRVALAKMEKGDWAGAKAPLDRILEIAKDDRHWATAGRAAYFRARVAEEEGHPDDARDRLVGIVQKYPLQYYMLLAYDRLASKDRALAERVMKEAAAKDASGSFPSREHEIFASPGVARAERLLEVGEIDAAKHELSKAGALAKDVDPEVVWMVGALYEQAGAPHLGHAFSRRRLTKYREHWPEGRWRTPWEIAYPRAFEPVVVKACADNALPTTVAWAVMREESSFLPTARSRTNALGLMQLMGGTAKWIAKGTDFSTDEDSLKKPEVSVGLGVRLLAKLRKRHAHPALAIGAYNGGSGAMGRWVKARADKELGLFVELIPWKETRNYVKRVLSTQAAYAYLYDPSALAEPLGLPLRLPH